MTNLLDNDAFKKFLANKSGRYQPIPIAGLWNPAAVRANGCVERWGYICGILPKDRPQRILDVGCNLGFFGMAGADSGHSVDGFDTDEEAIFWGNAIIKEYSIPSVNLWVSSNDLLANLREIPDDSYDYIFYFSLHHHIYSRLDVDEAHEVIQEMSRIAPHMVFDMGQSNEIDNGWLTWIKKVPQFKNHRVDIPQWILDTSGYEYAACIGNSLSHGVDRHLFLFTRGIPNVDYSQKIVTVKDPGTSGIVKGYRVILYVWKDRGGIGALHTSTTSFPIMDLKSSMCTRYYVATDLAEGQYFIKEYLYCWLSPNKNYHAARVTYERGKMVQGIEGVSNRVVHSLALDGNKIVYPYYNWPSMLQLGKGELMHDFFDELLEITGKIYQKIGVFDLNPNNILYNKETGEFKLIDFESGSPNFSFAILQDRIAFLHNVIRGGK